MELKSKQLGKCLDEYLEQYGKFNVSIPWPDQPSNCDIDFMFLYTGQIPVNPMQLPINSRQYQVDVQR